ncbi:MarR family winged helix-turn-helix transcriptional regulator [Mesobacillus maritimus]|uniref:MarR family winged helix-turn-helix transcriptional regulator n=1 Tax=Mesobacillus maritimus TaxID=1643336 RepID=UPI00384AA551
MNLLQKQNILLTVRALYFCLDEHWAKLGRTFNLTPAQQHILFLLSTNNGTLTPSQISQLGCWHCSTVTRLLRPLEKKGYITLSVHPLKPRSKRVTLTHDGTEALKRVVEFVKKMDSFPFNLTHLPEKELIQFLKTGQQILTAHKGVEFKEKVLEAKMEGMDYA